MKKIEIEVFTEAFQIKMDYSYWVIIYSEDDESNMRAVVWYDHEKQELQDGLMDFKPFIIEGKMIGWSQIPFFI